MSFIDVFAAPYLRRHRSFDVGGVGSAALSALRMLLAGMRASKEYRHLNGMTDQQLGTIGLSRDRIEEEVRRRHLAHLGGRFARAD